MTEISTSPAVAGATTSAEAANRKTEADQPSQRQAAEEAYVGFWGDLWGSVGNTLKSQANGAIQLSNHITGSQAGEFKLTQVDDPNSSWSAWGANLVGQAGAIALEFAGVRRATAVGKTLLGTTGTVAEIATTEQTALQRFAQTLSAPETAWTKQWTSAGTGVFMGTVLTPTQETDDPAQFAWDRIVSGASQGISLWGMTRIGLGFESKATQMGSGLVASTLRSGYFNQAAGGYIAGSIGNVTSSLLHAQLPDLRETNRAGFEFALIGMGTHAVDSVTTNISRRSQDSSIEHAIKAESTRRVPAIADELAIQLAAISRSSAEPQLARDNSHDEFAIPERYTSPGREHPLMRHPVFDPAEIAAHTDTVKAEFGNIPDDPLWNKLSREKAAADLEWNTLVDRLKKMPQSEALPGESIDEAYPRYYKDDPEEIALYERQKAAQARRNHLDSMSDAPNRIKVLTGVVDSLRAKLNLPEGETVIDHDMDEGSLASYTLGSGKVSINQRSIESSRDFSFDRLAESTAHELWHLKQDKTTIWQLADKAGIGATWTSEDVAGIAKAYADILVEPNERFIENVLKIRNGKQLSEKEAVWADNLQDDLQTNRGYKIGKFVVNKQQELILQAIGAVEVAKRDERINKNGKAIENLMSTELPQIQGSWRWYQDGIVPALDKVIKDNPVDLQKATRADLRPLLDSLNQTNLRLSKKTDRFYAFYRMNLSEREAWLCQGKAQ